MYGDFSNQVKTAVDRVGGPTKTAHRLHVSNATIHTWIKNQRVPDIDKANVLAAASGVDLGKLRRTK